MSVCGAMRMGFGERVGRLSLDSSASIPSVFFGWKWTFRSIYFAAFLTWYKYQEFGSLLADNWVYSGFRDGRRWGLVSLKKSYRFCTNPRGDSGGKWGFKQLKNANCDNFLNGLIWDDQCHVSLQCPTISYSFSFTVHYSAMQKKTSRKRKRGWF